MPLDTAGWAHNGSGEIVNGQTRVRPEGTAAFFKHSQELQGGDVWRMRVEGGDAWVGFATEKYNVNLRICNGFATGRYKYGKTVKSTAGVYLGCGTTDIDTDISQDGQDHYHNGHLRPHIPAAPFDLAVRCEAVSNVPQIQFNEDDVWHDFAPGRVALKAGPWFPYLQLYGDDRLSDHCVHRPKPT